MGTVRLRGWEAQGRPVVPPTMATTDYYYYSYYTDYTDYSYYTDYSSYTDYTYPTDYSYYYPYYTTDYPATSAPSNTASGEECLNYNYLVWAYVIFFIGEDYPSSAFPHI